MLKETTKYWEIVCFIIYKQIKSDKWGETC